MVIGFPLGGSVSGLRTRRRPSAYRGPAALVAPRTYVAAWEDIFRVGPHHITLRSGYTTVFGGALP